MPAQLTLRSPKGGRVLHERLYENGHRIDAVAGWLVVVDRNGSVVAAHAACPGLEGALVEHASAAPATRSQLGELLADTVEPGGIRGGIRYPAVDPHGDDEEGDGGPEAPPLRVADLRLPGHPIDDALLDDLHTLGRTYGPLGVALAAAALTDVGVLVQRLTEPDDGEARPEPDRPEDSPDGTPPAEEDPREFVRVEEANRVLREERDGYEANLDALRAEVARLSGLLDEQTARAEREHAARVRLEGRVGHLRVQLDSERENTPLDGPTTVEFRKAGIRFDYLPVPEGHDLRAHPAALRVFGPGLVTFDGRELRVTYDPAAAADDRVTREPVELYVPVEARVSWDGAVLRALYLRPHGNAVGEEAYTDGKGRPLTIEDVRDEQPQRRPDVQAFVDLDVTARRGGARYGEQREEASPHPIEEDPRRPHLDAYPSDALLLTYAEVRKLLALHIAAVADSILSPAGQARAMRDGETPLRLPEVLA